MVQQVFNEIAGDDGSMDIQEFVQWLNAEWRAQRLRQRGEVVEGYDDGENDVDEIPDAENMGDGEGSEGGDDIDPYLSTAGSAPTSPLKARGDAPDAPSADAAAASAASEAPAPTPASAPDRSASLEEIIESGGDLAEIATAEMSASISGQGSELYQDVYFSCHYRELRRLGRLANDANAHLEGDASSGGLSTGSSAVLRRRPMSAHPSDGGALGRASARPRRPLASNPMIVLLNPPSTSSLSTQYGAPRRGVRAPSRAMSAARSAPHMKASSDVGAVPGSTSSPGGNANGRSSEATLRPPAGATAVQGAAVLSPRSLEIRSTVDGLNESIRRVQEHLSQVIALRVDPRAPIHAFSATAPLPALSSKLNTRPKKHKASPVAFGANGVMNIMPDADARRTRSPHTGALIRSPLALPFESPHRSPTGKGRGSTSFAQLHSDRLY